MRCNIYHISCLGEKFEWGTNRDGTRKKDCKNRVCEPNNTPSPMQVDAFGPLFRRKIKGGMDNLTAFVEAIVQTSGDVFEKATRKRPDSMDEYYRLRNKRRRDA